MNTLVDTAAINWEDTGDGSETIVLLHDNGESLGVWSRFIEPFAEKYRVITVDTRGHGESTQGAWSLDLTEIASDITAVLSDAKIAEAVLMGVGDGAAAALTFATRNPDRVRAVIAVSPRSSPSGWKFTRLFHMWLRRYTLGVGMLFSKSAVRERDLLKLRLSYPKIYNWQLRELSVPTLLVSLRGDGLRPSHAEYLRNLIPGAELIHVDADTGEFYSAPEIIISDALDFLSKT